MIAYIWDKTQFNIILVTSIIFLVYLAYNLFAFIDKWNNHLIDFFTAIRQGDFSNVYNVKGLGSSFDELRNIMNDVINDFKRVRVEKEQNANYLQNVLNHIGIAIFAFNNNENIEFFNQACKKLFYINRFSNLTDLKKINENFYETIKTIQPDSQTLANFEYNDILFRLSVHVTKFNLNHKTITIVSMQNIHSELEQQEMQSWQQLIKVLRHEIMNSITPISSLSDSLQHLTSAHFAEINQLLPADFQDDYQDDITQSLLTINKRSKGLLKFVEKYRNLSKISDLEFDNEAVLPFLQSTAKIFAHRLKQNNIMIDIECLPENMRIIMDCGLIEQIMVNLIKNAIYAVKYEKKPHISLRAFQTDGTNFIKVIDNGTGIKPEITQKIFIPFFTTKEDGDGIGLSIAKQIMHLHKGRITVQSKPGKTEFTLIFQKL